MFQVGATETTQTLIIPNFLSPGVSSVSVLGVDSDGVTTYLYFQPDAVLATTFIGAEFPS
jgi:hypothetical protein